MVIAAVTFCAEEGEGFPFPTVILDPNADFTLDDPLAAVFSGRVVEETPNEGALNRVDRWIASCNEHSGCEHRGKEMPTRVIDVDFPGVKGIVKLMETSGETQDSYIALSYCWGIGKKGYVTTKANLTQRKDNGFEAMILPRTIRDAIELARRLRIRYLWVDGLCICQDDTADWDRESRMMGRVTPMPISLSPPPVSTTVKEACYFHVLRERRSNSPSQHKTSLEQLSCRPYLSTRSISRAFMWKCSMNRLQIEPGVFKNACCRAEYSTSPHHRCISNVCKGRLVRTV